MESKYKVLYVDTPAGWEPTVEAENLAKVGVEVVVGRVKAEDDIIKAGQGFDGFLVRHAKITRKVMESLPQLKVVGRTGIGVDAVDVEAATELGVAVCNQPGFCAPEVADHTLLFVLACAKRFNFHQNMIKAGAWDQNPARALSAVRAGTLGLVAFGDIGREVATRARPFGLRVIAFDPYITQEKADPYGVQLVSLETLLAESDFVSVHAPHTKGTHHMLSTAQFAQMKPTAYVLNTARGPVVDEQALIAALKEGRIAGAALDVFEQEPPDKNNPLFSMENVIVTPHVAGYSTDSTYVGRVRISTALGQVLTGTWPERDLFNRAVLKSPNLRQR